MRTMHLFRALALIAPLWLCSTSVDACAAAVLNDRKSVPASLEQVRVFEAKIRSFVEALVREDGANGAAMVDDYVLQEFEDCRNKALFMSLQEFKDASVQFCPMEQVMLLRVNFSAEDLQSRTGKGVLSELISRGMLVEPWIASAMGAQLELRDVKIFDDTGEAMAKVWLGGKKVDGVYAGLSPDANDWRLNVRSIVVLQFLDRMAFAWMRPQTAEQQEQLQSRRLQFDKSAEWMNRFGMGTHLFAEAHGELWFATFTDHPFDPKYWQPMVPKGK